MKKLSLGLMLVLGLVMAAGVFAVQAAPATPTPQPIKPSFTDGRVNAYDPGAPVAIFETHKTVPIVNDNGVPTTADVVNGVQLLFWDGASAKEVMNVSSDTINAAIARFMGTKSTTTVNSTANTSLNSSNAAVSTAVPSTNTSTSASATPSSSTSTSNANANTSNTSTTNANTTANTTKLTTINNGNSVLISKVNGYSLYFSKDGYLWITTPANFEGKVYTFSWQKNF